ncbi:MAG: L,D-transpeptidase family protein [Candidatus Methanosuratincola sp.]
MGTRINRLTAALISVIALCATYASADASREQVAGAIRSRLEQALYPRAISVGREHIYDSLRVRLFYERRSYAPAWSTDRGMLPQALSLIDSLSGAESHGLRARYYHVEEIRRMLRLLSNPGGDDAIPLLDLRAELDLLLTDGFFSYASDLMGGRMNPRIFPTWGGGVDRDLIVLLEGALSRGAVSESLENLAPQDPAYRNLREALRRYRNIASTGGWESIPPGGKLEIGDRGRRVSSLRRRLKATGDLTAPEGEVFDHTLFEAVKVFQRRHGLATDGVVGSATLSALNVPVEERVRQMELNLERMRWFPREPGGRYILVNIPGFELSAFEGGRRVISMRAITGRPSRPTPLLAELMTYLVLSPYWNVPPGIAAKDILPAVRKDPGYLRKNGFRVFRVTKEGISEVDPDTIDWSQASARDFLFRQEPGAKNAMGRVKFMFPNVYDVYIHDTPHRELFEKPVRAFSSGCIRIENPIDLAEFVLRDSHGWTRERILEEIDRNIEEVVYLPEPIPVYLVYYTAWVGEGGEVEFRDDVYGLDSLLDEALKTGRRAPFDTATLYLGRMKDESSC